MSCYRCGSCCKDYFAIIPKNENSNLSENYLDSIMENKGIKFTMKYIEENSIPLKGKCKWLQNEHSIATCIAYDKRSTMCSDHMKDDYCNTGLIFWKRHLDKGNQIPNEILVSLKEHPFYKKIFNKGELKCLIKLIDGN